MTYRKISTAKQIELENGVFTSAVKATVADEFGGKYHIAEDDHCYVIFCEDSASGICRLTSHLFPELFEILRKMPPLAEVGQGGGQEP